MPWARLPSTASAASMACSCSGSSPAATHGINNIPSSLGGQLMGMMAFLPLAFLPGYFSAWALKKLGLLRVAPEVELEGLDLAEFGVDFYPEFERVPEVIVMPDGERSRPPRSCSTRTGRRPPDRRARERKESHVRRVPVRRVG